MERLKKKRSRRIRVKRGVRGKIFGNAQRPRLSVFRSNKEIYAQLIDDVNGHTLAAYSSLDKDFSKEDKTNAQIATEVGEKLAELASSKNITAAVFDRNGYRYHGRVKALAEGVRKGGLNL